MAKQKEATEKMIDCLAIKNTSTHAKGNIYSLTELEAKKGIDAGLFVMAEPITVVSETPVE